MSPRIRHVRAVRTALLLGAGTALLSVSGSLLSTHASAVLEVREVSLPLIAEIPALERRVTALRDQVELAELNAATRLGSAEERVHVFVLPESVDYDRLLSIFDILGQELKSERLLTDFTDITLGEPVASSEPGLEMRPISLRFSAHEEGVQLFLSLVRLSGLLEIGDTLSTDERRLLLAKTEDENPAGVVAVEQFLSADLLRYAKEPKTYEEQLTRAFSSPSFLQSLEDVLQAPLLRDARRLLGGRVGASLEHYDLWPLPMIVLDDARIQAGGAPGWFTLSVTLQVYNRSGDS